VVEEILILIRWWVYQKCPDASDKDAEKSDE